MGYIIISVREVLLSLKQKKEIVLTHVCIIMQTISMRKDFAQQVALHQLLYRKLLKYAYENDAAAADCDWTSNAPPKKFYIIWNADRNKWIVDWHCSLKSNDVYFNKKKIAEQAISKMSLNLL